MTESDIFVFPKRRTRIKTDKPFIFAAVGLSHSHIYGMCRGLTEAGAELRYVYEEDAALRNSFIKEFPQAEPVNFLEELLDKREVGLIVCAAIPSDRADIAEKAMRAGKDFFVDKAPFISLLELERIKLAINDTHRKYFVYYSESIHNEAAIFARYLVERGVIGKVFHIDSLAPHFLGASSRPDWFFKREHTGGIITDLGSHQVQQFLGLTGAQSAEVDFARTANFNNLCRDDFDDFGDFAVTASNGATGYFRIDWASPEGLGTWGDARMIIEGSDGYIELRKNCNIGMPLSSNHVYVVTRDGTFYQNVTGKVGFAFFADIISDCAHRTDTAMNIEEALAAAQISITAQSMALKGRGP